MTSIPIWFLGSVHRKLSPVGSGAPKEGAHSAATRSPVEPASPCSKDLSEASRLGAGSQGCQAAREHLLQRPHGERRTRGPLLFIGRLEEDHAPIPTALVSDWLVCPGWPRLLPSHTQESRAFQLETWHAEEDSGPRLPAHLPCHWCGTPAATTPPFQPPGWEGGRPLLIGRQTCLSRERLARPSLPSLLPRAPGFLSWLSPNQCHSERRTAEGWARTRGCSPARAPVPALAPPGGKDEASAGAATL